jgi:hypothetical protein
LYAWSLSYLWVFVALGVVVVNSILIYTAIRRQERRNKRYSFFAATATPQNSSAFNLPQKKSRDNRPVATTLEAQNEVGAMAHESPDDTCNNSIERTESNPTEEFVDGNGNTTTDLKGTQPIVVCQYDAARATSTHIHQTNPDSARAPSLYNSNNRTSYSTRRRSSIVSTTSKAKKASQVAAWQSTLYCAAVLVPTIVISLPWFAPIMGASDGGQMVCNVLVQYLLATQGIFNLFIYIRPAYKRLRESADNSWSRLQCLSISLFSSDPQYW